MCLRRLIFIFILHFYFRHCYVRTAQHSAAHLRVPVSCLFGTSFGFSFDTLIQSHFIRHKMFKKKAYENEYIRDKTYVGNQNTFHKLALNRTNQNAPNIIVQRYSSNTIPKKKLANKIQKSSKFKQKYVFKRQHSDNFEMITV